jgi:sec-independent protein translocase protein TatA
MFNLGPTELIIILVIVLIVFGVGRLPEIGGALGKSIREFRQASTDADKAKAKDEEAKDSTDEKPVA